MSWFKKMLYKLIESLKGKAKAKVEERIDPKPVSSDTQSKSCGCDLSKPVILPLTHLASTQDKIDAILAAGGYECGGNPKDIRISLMRPDGRAWIYRYYFKQGVLILGNDKWSGQCFDNPDGAGRFHFIGWSKSDLPKDIIKAKAGDVLPYDGTTFGYWELRG